MAENINHLINPVISNGAAVTHNLNHLYLRIQNYVSSTFIEKQKILVKGEYFKDDFRKALILFFDLETGKVKGKPSLFDFLIITSRLWTELQNKMCQLSRPL